MSIIKISGTDVDPSHGLNATQVQQFRERFGRNELSPPKRAAWWEMLLEKFEDPTIRILLLAAFASLTMTAVSIYVLGDKEASFTDSLGIFIAVFLATLVGYFSERKSEKEFELLNQVKDNIEVKVLRDGNMTTVPIGEIVFGDLVRLDLGDKVPADGVLIDALSLSIDESLLTGESFPVEKRSIAPESWEHAPPETHVARGTMVADGHGMFLTTAIGDKTRMGEIAGALHAPAASEANVDTPLKQKLSRLANQISVVGASAATGIFTVMGIHTLSESRLVATIWEKYGFANSWVVLLALICGLGLMRWAILPFFRSLQIEVRSLRLQGLLGIPMFVGSLALFLAIQGFFLDSESAMDLLHDLLLSVVVAVTIIVVAVPEGLPMMVTVSLAMNMMKMARENCLVRKLIASETIGSTTVICTDKTGTLTQNKMQPVWFYLSLKEYSNKDIGELEKTKQWESLIQNIAINTEAHLKKEDDGAVRGIGNPTECALLHLLYDRKIDYRELRDRWERINELNYNSQRKMSVVMIDRDGEQVCFSKGAPERILAQCNLIRIGNTLESVEPHLETIRQAIENASSNALRLIAFSETSSPKHCPGGKEFAENENGCLSCGDRVFVGLVGIADPIRPEVADAVRLCQQAGIQVKMITGDARPTAVAIAREAGIIRGQRTEDRGQGKGEGAAPELILTSEGLAKIDEGELPEIAQQLRVLARSTPIDKLRLVGALHKRGEVVAMTGDGTNDAPALKKADVGVSMGISGTEVAKEASDIVLVDDNFRSIVTGVWWGRTLYQNIQRFLQFQLSVNVVALCCALLGPLFDVPLPLTVPQLLWINIIMDTFAALALCTDPPRKKTMSEPPIRREAHIITPEMGITVLINGLFQVVVLFAVLFSGAFTNETFEYGVVPSSPEYYERTNLEPLTVFFTVFIMFQFWHKFNCRALRHDDSPFTLLLKNRMFLGIVGAITIVQIIMVQSEWVGKFFRTVPLSLSQWLEITVLTATILPVAWFARKFAHWVLHRRSAERKM